MGKLYHILSIVKTLQDFELEVFVETGTGSGDAVTAMLQQSPQMPMHTIEIFDPIFQKAQEKFRDHANVTVHHGESPKVLSNLVPSITVPTLFWLDAHYPGADYGYQSYDAELNTDVRLPLERELEAICTHKNVALDVFVMDDLRIYEDGPFQNGTMAHAFGPGGKQRLGADGINFIYTWLEPTHHILKSYQEEGYILAFPKHGRTPEQLQAQFIR